MITSTSVKKMYICGKLSDTDILSEVLNNKSISVGDNEDIEDEVEKKSPIQTSSETIKSFI